MNGRIKLPCGDAVEVAALALQSYDLELTGYDERGWRATFYTTGMEHSPTSAMGTGWGAQALARDAAGGVGGVEQGLRGATDE